MASSYANKFNTNPKTNPAIERINHENIIKILKVIEEKVEEQILSKRD